jgi:SnoaL-like domain
MTERHSLTIVWIALVVGILVAAFVAVRAQNRSRPAALTAMDYVEIEQLNAAYGHYIDTGADQGQAWARLFTQDAVFTRQNGDKYIGREQIAGLGRIIGSRGPKAVAHFATNVWIQPAPDGAVGQVYAVIIRFPDDKMDENDPRPVDVKLGARYHDTYAKTAEGWRFKTRTVVMAGSNRTAQGTAAPR